MQRSISYNVHCVKSVRILSYSGIILRIQFERGKTQTRITPNTNTFHAVVYILRHLHISTHLVPYTYSIIQESFWIC